AVSLLPLERACTRIYSIGIRADRRVEWTVRNEMRKLVRDDHTYARETRSSAADLSAPSPALFRRLRLRPPHARAPAPRAPAWKRRDGGGGRGEPLVGQRWSRSRTGGYFAKPSCFMKSWLSQNSHSWSIVPFFQ